MLEKEIEKKVCDYAKTKNVLSYKFVSPSNRGVPDRLFVTENGIAFFIEFKAKGKKPTVLQESKMQTLRKNKALVFLVDDVELGKLIINNMIKR